MAGPQAYLGYLLPLTEAAKWKPGKGYEYKASILFPCIAHSFCMFKISHWVSPLQTNLISPGTCIDIWHPAPGIAAVRLFTGALSCLAPSPPGKCLALSYLYRDTIRNGVWN